MVQHIITPWRTHNELLKVRHQLYPSSSNHAPQNTPPTKSSKTIEKEKHQAVAKISVWMQRGNCPHLVESTAILTAAILNDLGQGNSTYCVRAAYAAAFGRFVTGLLDTQQTHQRKQSMYSLAKTIGLPSTYVELRHQATHEELPSLARLRVAARKALGWIWVRYWEGLENRREEGCFRDLKAVLGFEVDGDREGERGEGEREREVLRKWGGERVREVVMEMLEGVRDVRVLRRGIKILQRISEMDDVTKCEDSSTTTIEKSRNIDEIRAEMLEMEKVLNETKEVEADVMEVVEDISLVEGKGWAVWEGPWVAKPIGVV